MIGSKKLSTIRQELRRALKATGEDPIRWLEKRMAAFERQNAASDGNEVLQSLRRLLEEPPKKRRRKSRGRAK